MNRREFLLLRPEGIPKGVPYERGNSDPAEAVLSCERLYMRYLDSQMDGSTATLFANLREDLHTIKTLRLTDTSWLSCAELKEQLDAALRDCGGTETR